MTMREQIASLPAQLRWAADQPVPSVGAARGAVVCGMGGSAMAGDIAAYIASGQGLRAVVHRGYGLPAWVGPGDLVVAISYSGNTEETLAAVDEAEARDLAIAVVAAGGELTRRAEDRGWPAVVVEPGLQPRAAVGYLTGAALRLLQGAGGLADPAPELEEAASIAEGVLGRGTDSDDVTGVASGLEGRVAVIYGAAGVPAIAARRWKTQLNEIAKSPAFWSELPELDHNEIEGWVGMPEVTRKLAALVWLRDDSEGERNALRAEFTRDLIEGAVPLAGEVWSTGSGRLARLFSLISLGDLTALTLAERSGVDPVAVERIDELKRRLEGGRT